jgi:hypothetical protein
LPTVKLTAAVRPAIFKSGWLAQLPGLIIETSHPPGVQDEMFEMIISQLNIWSQYFITVSFGN